MIENDGRPVGTRTPDLYRVKVALIGFTTTYKTAGTAKVRGSSYKTYFLWVGLWVGNVRNESAVIRCIEQFPIRLHIVECRPYVL
jgi:hypothetical protein